MDNLDLELINTIKESRYLSITPKVASQRVGGAAPELTARYQQHPYLEIVQKNGKNGFFHVIQLRCEPTALAHLDGVAEDLVRQVYRYPRGQIDKVLDQGVKAGVILLQDGLLRRGPNQSMPSDSLVVDSPKDPEGPQKPGGTEVPSAKGNSKSGAKLEFLLGAIRSSDYLNLFLNKAAEILGLSIREAEFEIQKIPYLVVESRFGKKPFKVVLLRLSSENLPLLDGVELSKLKKSYSKPAGALESAIKEAEDRGLISTDGGVLRALETQAPPTGTSGPTATNSPSPDADPSPPPPAKPKVPPPPKSPEGPPPTMSNDAVEVLGLLEDLEAKRINFGLYETFITVDDIDLEARQRNLPLGGVAIKLALEELVKAQMVLRVRDGFYRSRISETVRVVKNLKQRFRANDAATAPELVQSIRVHFADRKRLRRDVSLKKVLQDNSKTGHRGLRDAAQILLEGFSQAIGQAPDETQITAVQQRALESLTQAYLEQKGKGVVITGNTGSGKTEAMLLPLLLGMLQENLTGHRTPGTRLVLVYPRQALAKNQLQRLARYLAAINQVTLKKTDGTHHVAEELSLGIVFGETPQNLAEMSGSDRTAPSNNAWTKVGSEYHLPYFTTEQGDPVLCQIAPFNPNNATLTSPEGWELGHFRATRDAIMKQPPDILVITTEMLHRWLWDERYLGVFGLSNPQQSRNAPQTSVPKAFVFDEIHLYDGVHGAQVGMLIRRLRHRLEQAMYQRQNHEGWRYPLAIGMSATIGNPQDFWQRLSGVPFVEAIEPRDEDLEAAQGREYFLFIRPESYSRGRPVGDASVAIQTIMAISHNMRRRGPTDGTPPKFRSLVFQDSISKIKKLAVEFTDAESNKKLSLLRHNTPSGEALESAEYHDGEYWYFDNQDPWQYSQQRTQPGLPPTHLTSSPSPVYSGSGKHVAEMLEKDIIFATTSLEVGYDDSSIQFVMQHHAPANPASFVQKKGRAGRSLSDRPVVAVTLSRHSFRDSFYYQNPQQLYDPAGYTPPLSVDNYFVQRFQLLAAIFDELTRLTGKNWQKLPKQAGALRPHLVEINTALDRHSGALERMYGRVASKYFQKLHPEWRAVWSWYLDCIKDDYLINQIERAGDLFLPVPEIPANLFSTLNLPTVKVMYPSGRSSEESSFEFADEDIALALTEVVPGKVSRRYGGRYKLYWRPPYSSVELERHKEAGPNRAVPGPFRPNLLKPLAALNGDQPSYWQDRFPKALLNVYPANGLPEHFYRLRYYELWSFGTINPNNPKKAESDWEHWGRVLPNGQVHIERQKIQRNPTNEGWRQVSPDSDSRALKFSLVDTEGAPQTALQLPPLFSGLLDQLDPFYGQPDSPTCYLKSYEVYYGAEATVRLIPIGRNDPKARNTYQTVRFVSKPSGPTGVGVPTLYGYDLRTEGLRASYDPNRLKQVAGEVFAELWSKPRERHHLKDQMLRFLLKEEPWPTSSAPQVSSPDEAAPAAEDEGVNRYDQRKMAEVLATLQAEFAETYPNLKLIPWLFEQQNAAEWQRMVRKYYPDERWLNPGLIERFVYSLAEPKVQQHLQKVFEKVQDQQSVLEFVEDCIVHSLEHATRKLFVNEGSSKDEECGSHVRLRLHYQQQAIEPAFYIYERNQGGSGATRNLSYMWPQRSTAHRLKRWREESLSCVVGDEEDFLKAAMQRFEKELGEFVTEYMAAPRHERKNPRVYLGELFKGFMEEDDPLLQRLGGLLTSELSLFGTTIERFAVQLELHKLERRLQERLQRRITPLELAGYAYSELQKPDHGLLQLQKLQEIYRTHQEGLEQGSDPAELDLEAELDAEPTWKGRFLSQVEHLALSTCSDSCPACLAASCDQAPVEISRHSLSRKLLKRVHVHLTKSMTLTAHEVETMSPQDIRARAAANGGFVYVDSDRRLPVQLRQNLMAADLDHRADILDFDELTIRYVFHLRQS